MTHQEGVALLNEILNDQNILLQQLDEIPEILGSTEDIMIDDAAMDLLRLSIERVIAQIRQVQHKVQQAIHPQH